MGGCGWKVGWHWFNDWKYDHSLNKLHNDELCWVDTEYTAWRFLPQIHGGFLIECEALELVGGWLCRCQMLKFGRFPKLTGIPRKKSPPMILFFQKGQPATTCLGLIIDCWIMICPVHVLDPPCNSHPPCSIVGTWNRVSSMMYEEQQNPQNPIQKL